MKASARLFKAAGLVGKCAKGSHRGACVICACKAAKVSHGYIYPMVSSYVDVTTKDDARDLLLAAAMSAMSQEQAR